MKEARNYQETFLKTKRGGVKLVENPEKSLGAKCRNPNETMGGEFFPGKLGRPLSFSSCQTSFSSGEQGA